MIGKKILRISFRGYLVAMGWEMEMQLFPILFSTTKPLKMEILWIVQYVFVLESVVLKRSLFG